MQAMVRPEKEWRVWLERVRDQDFKMDCSLGDTVGKVEGSSGTTLRLLVAIEIHKPPSEAYSSNTISP